MTDAIAPYISATGRSKELWNHDAGGALGGIQLVLKDCLGDDDYTDTLLVVALSGGPDSLALAAGLLRAATRRVPAGNLVALTVDHEWRAESASEAAAAAKCARDLGYAQAKVLRAQIPETGAGPEGSAREMRWRLMTRAALSIARERKLKSIHFFTGHTLDDQAETVLLRLGRGASLLALSAMWPVDMLDSTSGLPRREEPLENSVKNDEDVLVWISRPLLGVRRETTHEACRQAGLIPAHDPTNELESEAKTAAGEALPRVAIRQRVLPELRRALGQDPAPALARLAEQAYSDEMYLQVEAAEVLDKVFMDEATWDVGQPLRLDFSGIGKARIVPRPILRRVMYRAGRWAGMRAGDVTMEHLESVTDLVHDWHGQGPLDLPGVKVSRENGQIVFRKTGN
ncbi:tRNA lysidine(34) synthetase TilS [Mobiluncus mulieris]|uniref:tRNA(Ile)-lysidine synthase n=1 Tax=Mobiluncus mulieris TaxID=2052 RepID=A0A7Y0URY0_9ACTO|nr:tRNA lysidine(34) synthetase TilS [Mobiluncus mulieris]NMX02585.1 tRNA lysidine(34) synthetase TilS [Mobiluncus mulieris]NMX11235.1 tRNA lysidine(34) synthetase TilS [Mobiluncus mulieris]